MVRAPVEEELTEMARLILEKLALRSGEIMLGPGGNRGAPSNSTPNFSPAARGAQWNARFRQEKGVRRGLLIVVVNVLSFSCERFALVAHGSRSLSIALFVGESHTPM